MSNLRNYTEDSYGLSTCNESALSKSFTKMHDALAKVGKDPFVNVEEVCRTPEYLSMLVESIQVDVSDNATLNQYQLEDAKRLNSLYGNVSESIMNEAVQNVSNISPIMINSFGIQERALISTHLPRAVKQVTAKIDNFKLTERMPFITDLAGNKMKFIDAFVPNADGSFSSISLKDKVTMKFAVPSTGSDLYAGHGTSGDPDFRPVIGKDQVFGYDSIIKALTITNIKAGTTPEFTSASRRNPSVEDGSFSAVVKFTTTVETVDTAHIATVSGKFDFSNGLLEYVSTTDSSITYIEFDMVLSPETHTKALTVGYETKHTPVQIPIGEHFEYNISEEFKDASDKYYNVDAMAMLTDYMGQGVEQVKDINTLGKFQELAENAIVKTTFNCTPTTGFAQGKEEYIRREFHPFMEKVCILLKTKVRIENCHFRVVGNPLDIRIAGAAGVEYIYKRNEQFAGEIGIDYEFSVTSDTHKIFYLSSERVPVGKIFVFLIPNSIDNNISTVNHYEYATYVSNKYRGTNSNLPTVMISTRYLTREYFPVVGQVTVINNLVDDTNSTTATGTGLSSAVNAKIDYVNA